MSRFVKIAGLCLASMLLASMALAGTASATPLWLVCLKGSGLTKYSSSTCLTASSGGEWQSLGLPAGTKVTVKLVAISIKLNDTGLGAGVKCGTTGSVGKGFIEGTNKGVIEEAKYESAGTDCEGTGLCSAPEEVKGVDLPWKTELIEVSGKVETKILADGHGEPGWTVRCSGITDECKAESEAKAESAELTSAVTAGELLVVSKFLKAHKAKCSFTGGAETGEVEGGIAILLPNGALSVNKA